MGSRVASVLRDPTTLAIGALAVHRLTRLAVADEITRPLRERITRWAEGTAERRAAPSLGYFASCPWCVSIYVAAGWAALTVTSPPLALAAGVPLAWSSVAGLLASAE
jgi:hypothetical protein